jgi:hypothetical protein
MRRCRKIQRSPAVCSSICEGCEMTGRARRRRRKEREMERERGRESERIKEKDDQKPLAGRQHVGHHQCNPRRRTCVGAAWMVEVPATRPPAAAWSLTTFATKARNTCAVHLGRRSRECTCQPPSAWGARARRKNTRRRRSARNHWFSVCQWNMTSASHDIRIRSKREHS